MTNSSDNGLGNGLEDSPKEGQESEYVEGINEAYKGKRAECEGGAGIKGTKYAGRQYFVGSLTGEYRDFGSFKWRWYLLAELTVKPDAYQQDAVWCEEESLIIEGE